MRHVTQTAAWGMYGYAAQTAGMWTQQHDIVSTGAQQDDASLQVRATSANVTELRLGWRLPTSYR